MNSQKQQKKTKEKYKFNRFYLSVFPKSLYSELNSFIQMCTYSTYIKSVYERRVDIARCDTAQVQSYRDCYSPGDAAFSLLCSLIDYTVKDQRS